MTALLPDLLQYMRMSSEDAACLAALHPVLEPHFATIAEEFYAAVWAEPRASAVLSGPDQVERLRTSLVEWMSSGLRGPFDAAFYEKRSRIGRRHVQIGLAQQYMFGAMNVVRLAYQQYVMSASTPAALAPNLRAINKLLDLELAIMLHHYQLDSAERIVERERRVQADRISSMQTMTAGLAHEIRNPLNSAKLQLELLDRRLRRGSSDPKLIEPSELAQHEIARLTGLITDFLAFARPLGIQRAEHDLAEILRTACDLARPAAELRQIDLVLVGATQPLVASLDGPKVHQIVENLVANALDAASVGGRVTVTLTAVDAAAVISVEDNGTGIPVALHARIYEPFFTTKSSGTGLGLSIVHSLVTLHDGTITLLSEPGGTRFDVMLPRRL